ncbi:MAG: hypothetical protein ACOVK2_02955 [Candidatus Fonsibacter sp.]
MADQTYKIKIDTQGTDKISDGLDKAAASSKNLKQQLREMTTELQGLEPGSQRFNQLSTAAGKLKDQINDTNAVIKATAGSAVENLSTAFSKTAGVGIAAFQGVGGAMAMFGGDAEQIQEMMGRLQGAMAMGQALKDFGALGDTFTDIKSAVIAAVSKMGLFTTATVTQATATGAQTAATTTANVAQKALNLSMLANPIFLVIAGIAALVGAFMMFSGEAEVAEGMNDRINASYERTAKASQAAMEALKQANSTRLKLMELEGASDRELHNEKLSNMLTEKTQRTFQIQDEEAAINKKKGTYKKALEEENWELAKKIADEIKQHRAKYKDLYGQQTKYYDDVKIENAQFTADQEKKEEEEAAKAEQKRKENAAKRKAAIDEIRKAEQEAADAKLSEEDREIVNVQRKYNALIATAKAYGQSTVKLEEGRVNELKVITDKYDKAEQDKENEKLKKEQDDREKYYDYLDGLEEDASVKRMMALDKEIEQLDTFLLDKTISQDEYNESYKNATEKAEGDITKIKKEEADKQAEIDKVANKKKIDDIISTTSQLASIISGIRDTSSGFLNDIVSNTLSGVSKMVELTNTEFKTTAEKIGAYAQAIGGIISGFVSAAQEANQQRMDENIASIELNNQTEKNLITEQYNNGIISKADYDQQVTDLDKTAKDKTLEIKKKAFEDDKKYKIASATIAGITGAVAAFTGAMSLGPIAGPIVGGVLAGAVGIMTAMNIAKIKASKFDGGAVTPTGPGGGTSTSTSSAPTPPSLTINGQANLGSEGQGNQLYGQRQQVIKAVVLESDITNTQNTLSNYQTMSEIG